ncbi:hypothetical protein An09g00410 [Aspergillus niger]|uniref:Uncharacterized protein n=2 Tax=Aspergillus niger TaxID=5061 RepID=A2QT13_ASPNC|nr:hypothetical protein An09g00410 [Aspergillus niger]CAL00301.1 hypothetical protein An09g00410 [Aspergillus niger]
MKRELRRGRRVIAGKVVASNSEVADGRRYRASGHQLGPGKLTICDQELILDNVLIRRVDSRPGYRADTTL